MKKIIPLLLFSLVLFCNSLYAQIKYSGQEFYVTLGGYEYVGNTKPYADSVLIHLAGKHNSNVTFYYKNKNRTVNYYVQAGSILSVRLDTSEIRDISNADHDKVDDKKSYDNV